MNAALKALFLYASVVKLAPVVGLLLPDRIPDAYGISVSDPNLLILLRHRAALFAVVGGLLAAAAFRAHLRPLATLAGLFSMLSFVAVVWLDGPANAQLTRYAGIDATAALAVLAGYLLDRRQRERRAATRQGAAAGPVRGAGS